jgi:hypothetical protein
VADPLVSERTLPETLSSEVPDGHEVFFFLSTWVVTLMTVVGCVDCDGGSQSMVPVFRPENMGVAIVPDPPVESLGRQLKRVEKLPWWPPTSPHVTIPPAAPAGPEAVRPAIEAALTRTTRENRRTGCGRRMAASLVPRRS